MPINATNVRRLFESCASDPIKAVVGIQHMLGLCDRNGNRYRDSFGRPVLRDPISDTGRQVQRIRPQEFSLAETGRGLLGHSLFEQVYTPGSTWLANNRSLLEASAGAVSASAFANINAFTGTVAGLMEVNILEAWQNPQFIADVLCPSESTRMFEGRKTIGVTRIGDQAEERLPGMPTKRVQFGERWITQPRTVENSLAAEVNQETIFLDLTGQAYGEANDLGTWLRYRKEIRCIDAFIGVTNTYVYNGNNYATYIANGFYDNDVSNNELLHYTNVQTTLMKFRDMTDPATGTRVLTNPNTILVQLGKMATARAIVGDLASGTRYQDASTAAGNVTYSESPYKNKFEILESPLVYERITAANGLNVSPADAEKYWWMFEKGKPLCYAENWPLRVQQAAPGQMDMIDRGVVLYVKADERGVPMVKEPRKAVRNKP
ncbi:hypothetical protein [Tuwongella immobilis]|uniref:Uncharacterized protein n=1 Tax=Tuwongella immobilis TaxID=692036 RepID=A0A6C2YNV3_9BACT|nr:hypothetical protein [Tuwongella immobilis]VIP03074.1 Uncharacterized protein OS=Planctomyces brasiliensis (strain ATCC 49424 / DSM 5305 / JCM 21570 / NBRC 103401 / IFAM 1448) GN=Plabr_0223 PE=4 SV=1 [Tuwongella immobilis]VTS03309.1 Uncharacterized protein OS=Planctomyces brasiliensis (strain ATCC 49424 / DSM 5305 / JCM 21570 / NBRC 103401 / IFAM 1448) GN=Plabr_0223 PE=4 SV=1 [Tuwongella immobilis]